MPEISREMARSLVSKFTAFAPLPQAKEGLALTIDTLIACARSEVHAKRIIEEIVDAPGDPVRWPSPERIRTVAWALLTDSEKRTHCKHCDGLGWRSAPLTIKGIEYANSVRCACNGGRLPAQPRDGKLASAAEAMEEVVW